MSVGFHLMLWVALPAYIFLTIHYWAKYKGTR